MKPLPNFLAPGAWRLPSEKFLAPGA